MRLRIVMLGFVLTAYGCGKGDAVTNPIDVTGSYSLESINGKKPGEVLIDSAGYIWEGHWGEGYRDRGRTAELRITASGQFSGSASWETCHWHVSATGQRDSTTVVNNGDASGTWVIDDRNVITFHPNSVDPTVFPQITGRLAGNALTIESTIPTRGFTTLLFVKE